MNRKQINQKSKQQKHQDDINKLQKRIDEAKSWQVLKKFRLKSRIKELKKLMKQ